MKKLLPDVFVSDIRFKFIFIELEQVWSDKALWCYVAGGEFRIVPIMLPICIFSYN